MSSSRYLIIIHESSKDSRKLCPIDRQIDSDTLPLWEMNSSKTYLFEIISSTETKANYILNEANRV